MCSIWSVCWRKTDLIRLRIPSKSFPNAGRIDFSHCNRLHTMFGIEHSRTSFFIRFSPLYWLSLKHRKRTKCLYDTHSPSPTHGNPFDLNASYIHILLILLLKNVYMYSAFNEARKCSEHIDKHDKIQIKLFARRIHCVLFIVFVYLSVWEHNECEWIWCASTVLEESIVFWMWYGDGSRQTIWYLYLIRNKLNSKFNLIDSSIYRKLLRFSHVWLFFLSVIRYGEKFAIVSLYCCLPSNCYEH